jgi:hypothetical protein
VKELIEGRTEELKQALIFLQKTRKAQAIFLVAVDVLIKKTYFFFIDPEVKRLIHSKFSLKQENGYSSIDAVLTRKEVIASFVSSTFHPKIIL